MPGRAPDLARRDAVMQLLGSGMTPREVARALGITAATVYDIRRRVAGGGARLVSERAADAEDARPRCDRCGLRGAHECLRAGSIRWVPL
jgi:transposase-like protein